MKLKLKNKKEKMNLKVKKKTAKKAAKKIIKDKDALKLFRAAFMRPDMKLKEVKKLLKRFIEVAQEGRHVRFEEDPQELFGKAAREKKVNKARQRELLDS